MTSAVTAPELDSAVDARTRANRANAQLSTGPRTASGKEISRLNATRHGLTGRAVVLATEDADAYAALCERFRTDWTPKGERELELVQHLADTQWRLNRIPALEAMVYAVGRAEYANLYTDADPSMRATLLELHIFKAEGKTLRNLTLQASRLRRYYDVCEKELRELQTVRKKRAVLKDAMTAFPSLNNIPRLPLGSFLQKGVAVKNEASFAAGPHSSDASNNDELLESLEKEPTIE